MIERDLLSQELLVSDLEVVGLRLVEGVNLGHHGVAEGVSPVAATRNKLLLELGMSMLWQLKNLAHFSPFNIEPLFGLLNDPAYPRHKMIKSTVQIQMQLINFSVKARLDGNSVLKNSMV